MEKVTCLVVLLLLICQALAQKKYIIRATNDGYELNPSTHHKYIHKPRPYHFGYNIKDEKGNSQWHKEQSDENNYRKGSYGYTDAHGIYRHVDYIADHEGFRAKIRTNEPGTDNYHPAHVYIQAEQPPHHLKSLYLKPAHPTHPHQQQEEYEDYSPNPKERVTYVPVYVPPGNSKRNEYHHE